MDYQSLLTARRDELRAELGIGYDVRDESIATKEEIKQLEKDVAFQRGLLAKNGVKYQKQTRQAKVALPLSTKAGDAELYPSGEGTSILAHEAAGSENTMTTAEIAAALGCAVRTVNKYAQKLGWTKNGVVTRFTKKQAAKLLVDMKAPASSGHKKTLEVALDSKVIDAIDCEAIERQLEMARLQLRIMQLENLLGIA
jgi:hypothetical protein